MAWFDNNAHVDTDTDNGTEPGPAGARGAMEMVDVACWK